MYSLRDEAYMKEAIVEAKKAASQDEVPIGAVLVFRDRIIARGHNDREQSKQATRHAEIQVIEAGNRILNNWRLADCELYVTLEPCAMCSGAILQSRIARVCYGASDWKGGTAGTLMNLLQDERFNHRAEVISGVLGDESGQLLSEFFTKIRQRNFLDKD